VADKASVVVCFLLKSLMSSSVNLDGFHFHRIVNPAPSRSNRPRKSAGGVGD
jgi:hypothetical protein